MEKKNLVQIPPLITAVVMMISPWFIENTDKIITIGSYDFSLGFLGFCVIIFLFAINVAKMLDDGEISILQSYDMGKQFLSEMKETYSKEFKELSGIANMHSAEIVSLYDCGCLLDIKTAKMRDIERLDAETKAPEPVIRNRKFKIEKDFLAMLTGAIVIFVCAYRLAVMFVR